MIKKKHQGAGLNAQQTPLESNNRFTKKRGFRGSFPVSKVHKEIQAIEN